ncbi:MAG: L,D-transpeptidase [Hyphomicrobiaceae bacterium]
MTKTVGLACLSAITMIALPMTTASAFHPFDEPSGYQMPDWSKRKAAKTATAGTPSRPATQIQTNSFFGNDDDEDQPVKPQQRIAKPSAVQNPPMLDGGGRPAISAVAPPVISFASSGAGSIIIDTSGRALYYTLSATTAYRYPISVGREGFTWTGTEKISRVQSWPDWRPPAEMKQRQPNLPDVMTGGVRNPLGAKALYLGNSLYRIHGTNDVKSIGQAASSGCFRMMNGHVLHLANVAGVGTTVKVVNKLPSNVAGNEGGNGGKRRSARVATASSN